MAGVRSEGCVDGSVSRGRTRAGVEDWPEILEIHRITGDACSMLKVAATNMGEFEEVIDRLAPYGQPSSTMVLSTPLAWHPVVKAPR